jgi:HEAT repeat protein
MKPNTLKPLLLAGLVALNFSAARAETEQELIATLQSGASAVEKCTACQKLRLVGTAKAVPAVAALLNDERVSQAARFALEGITAPEATTALREALGKTSGRLKAGVADSLGWKRDASAVPLLKPLLVDSDDAIASSAAAALGRIGGKDALAALKAARAGAAPTARPAVLEALMRSAEKLLAESKASQAKAIYESLLKSAEEDHVRVAAHAGLNLCAGKDALGQIKSALEGNDSAAQIAALQLAGGIQDWKATKAFADLLPKSQPGLQVALLALLRTRGDVAALPAVQAAARSEDSAVRTAALTALGELGDAGAVSLLAEAATSQDAAEQKAAREALTSLRRGDVAGALVTQLGAAKPAVQVELARALGQRADKSAVPPLLTLARSSDDAARQAGLRALKQVADKSHLAALVELLREANDASHHAEIIDMLSSVCERLQSHPPVNVKPILDGIASAPLETRVALLSVCSLFVDERVRAVLRTALRDQESILRDAAIRAACNSRDPELMPDLLTLARNAAYANLRILPIRGYVRLATDAEHTQASPAQRAEWLRQILPLASRPEEKWAVLAGLTAVPDPAVLNLVLPLLNDSDVQTGAAQAATQIADAIRVAHPEPARAAILKVLATTTNAPQRKAAEIVLRELNALADYITAWQVAGPYQVAGKECTELFDFVFPPEKPGANDANWCALPSRTDPQRPCLLDWLKALGGDQRVAYVRTRIHSAKEEPARLDLGSDDGVKAWLNGQVIRANNAVRGLGRDSDKIFVTLHEGWNILQLKVTQAVAGWEFSARFVKPDGERLEGLKYDATFGAE